MNACQTLLSTSDLTRTPSHTTAVRVRLWLRKPTTLIPTSLAAPIGIQPHCTNTLSYGARGCWGGVRHRSPHSQQYSAAPFAPPAWDIQLPFTVQTPGAQHHSPVSYAHLTDVAVARGKQKPLRADFMSCHQCHPSLIYLFCK